MIQRGDKLICKHGISSNGASIKSGDKVAVVAVGIPLSQYLIKVGRTGTIRALTFGDAEKFFEREVA